MGAGWFGDAFGCRLTCNLNDWARSARVTVNEEWGPDSALDFPLELSLAVKAVTDQIVELEALINDALAVRSRRADSSPTRRGDAAAATRMARGDESRRRRGRDVDSPWGQVAAAATA